MSKKKSAVGPPSFEFEKEFWSKGLKLIGSLDEAGRGPLAGPVVAAAVILDPELYPAGLNDSKKLTDAKRERLFDEIMEMAQVSIGIADHRKIDAVNIRQATLLAMRDAAIGLPITADAFLIDGNVVPEGLGKPARAIVSGDALSLSISAASIIAKVTRDRLMREFAKQYPQYGFDQHKGYGTPKHYDAIRQYGILNEHRRSFLKNFSFES